MEEADLLRSKTLHGNTQNIQGAKCHIQLPNEQRITSKDCCKENTTTVSNNSHNTDVGNNHHQITVPEERREKFY